MAAIVLSMVLHVLFFAVVAALAMWAAWTPRKTYVVNLVPMVAAVGVPDAPPAPPLADPPAGPGGARGVPDAASGARATTPPREAPRRERPASRAREPSLPAAEPLPPRSSVLPRPGEKEPPPLAGPRMASASPREAREVDRRRRPGAEPHARRSTGSPVGTGALSVNASDFPHAWYVRQVIQKVEVEWNRQNRLSEPRQRPLLYFEIQRNGSIKLPTLKESSGNSAYDQAALRAVVDAGPFPPLPQDWARPSLASR